MAHDITDNRNEKLVDHVESILVFPLSNSLPHGAPGFPLAREWHPEGRTAVRPYIA